MPRGNQKGGKKHKRGKKDYSESKALRVKEDGQEKNKNVSKKFMNIGEINDDFVKKM